MATSREAAARSVLESEGGPEGKLEENRFLDAWYVLLFSRALAARKSVSVAHPTY